MLRDINAKNPNFEQIITIFEHMCYYTNKLIVRNNNHL